MLLKFVERTAAFYDKNEVPHRITVVNSRQIEPDTESSDVPDTQKQTGLQS
jgi:hypothetical protein